MLSAYRAFMTDVRRYQMKPRSTIRLILLTQGLWACATYRFFHSLICHRSPILRKIVNPFSVLAQKWIEVVAGISLPSQCEIGEGLRIDHFGGVIINPRVHMGRNCNVGHGVTIGSGGRGFKDGHSLEGVPIIGDRVFIGPGAVLFGPIHIGNDVAIGANAVVTKSLSDRAVALGVPAKIVSYAGSFQYVNYHGMETDPERLASLLAREEANNDRADDQPN